MVGGRGGGVSHVIRRFRRKSNRRRRDRISSKSPDSGEVRKCFRGDALVASFESYRSLRNRVRDRLRAAQNEALGNGLQDLTAAAQAAKTSVDVVALSVLLGPSSVEGDRQSMFSHVIEVIRTEGEFDHVREHALSESVEVVRLRSAYHGSMPVIHEHLRRAWGESDDENSNFGLHAGSTRHEDQSSYFRRSTRPRVRKQTPAFVIVALEDADNFPEAILRDIVYSCGKRHSSPAEQRVMLVFGVSMSGDSVRAALGVTEATMVAPVSVAMPSAEVCFHAVVEHVFIADGSPLVLSYPLLHLLRSEFASSGGSLAAIERILDDACAFRSAEQDSIAPSVEANSDLCRIRSTVARPSVEKMVWRVILEGTCELIRSLSSSQPELARRERQAECAHLVRKRVRMDLTAELIPVPQEAAGIDPERAFGRLDTFAESSALASIRAGLKSANRPALRSALEAWNAALVDAVWPRPESQHDAVKSLRDLRAAIAELIAQLSPTSNSSRAVVEAESFPAVTSQPPKLQSDSVNPRSKVDDALDCIDSGGTALRERAKPRAQGGHAKRVRRAERLSAKQSTEAQPINALDFVRKGAVKCFNDVVGLAHSVLKTRSPIPRGVSERDQPYDQFCEVSMSQHGHLAKVAEPRSSFLSAMRNYGSENGASHEKTKIGARPIFEHGALGQVRPECVPDVARAYELLAEHGQTVNLSDWLKAYETTRLSSNTVSAEGSRPVMASQQSLLDPAETAKLEFVHAVSEFESLGVLRYASRRPDHVMRQIYE